MREQSGNIVFPGFTAPKHEWVRENEPQNYSKIHKFLLPAAFLNLYLTGEYVSDYSVSSGTSWLDIRNQKWSEELLRVSKMSLAQIPNLVAGSEKAGLLRDSLREKWGLLNDVVIAGGAGDNAASACGISALDINI